MKPPDGLNIAGPAAAEGCVFCALKLDDVVACIGSVIAIQDKFPVSTGHHLIIPRVHRRDYFELTREEMLDAWSLIHNLKMSLELADSEIKGFNIGANCGHVAGQTVFHCHIHLIPRRAGDVTHPKGGVRGVIPSKQSY